MAKIRNFVSFGAVFPHFCRDKRESCTFIGATCGLAWGGSPRYAPSPNFTALAYKCRLAARKIAKIGNFWYIFSPKGYISFINFYKIWRKKGLPIPHNHANFHLRGFKNVALRPPKSPKIAIFIINLPLRKNPEGP